MRKKNNRESSERRGSKYFWSRMPNQNEAPRSLGFPLFVLTTGGFVLFFVLFSYDSKAPPKGEIFEADFCGEHGEKKWMNERILMNLYLSYKMDQRIQSKHFVAIKNAYSMYMYKSSYITVKGLKD